MPFNDIYGKLITFAKNTAMEAPQTAIDNLRDDIRKKIGKSLDTPTDFDFLSNEIQFSLKEYISPTTLKRFYNYIPNNVVPRISTLNVLARYLGKTGWREYCDSINEADTPSNILKKEKINRYTKREKTFLIAIIITALTSSLLSFYAGFYLNKVQVHNIRAARHFIDDGGSIQVFDTLSKLILSKASDNCCSFYDTLSSPGCNKGKIIFLTRFNKKHKGGRDSYPIEILDKFVAQNSPEYNLYKSSLVQLYEQCYTEFYEKNIDSLKVELKNK